MSVSEYYTDYNGYWETYAQLPVVIKNLVFFYKLFGRIQFIVNCFAYFHVKFVDYMRFDLNLPQISDFRCIVSATLI